MVYIATQPDIYWRLPSLSLDYHYSGKTCSLNEEIGAEKEITTFLIVGTNQQAYDCLTKLLDEQFSDFLK
jgi:hypothetical protein